MHAPRPGRPGVSRPPAAWLAACCFCWLAGVTAATEGPAARVDLIRDVPTAGDLAAPATGQTLYVLEESSGRVVAVDPFEPTKRWIAVEAPAAGGPVTPRAIGSIDTGILAILCGDAGGWSIRAHRVQPGVTTPAADVVQSVPLPAVATAPGDAPPPAIGPDDGRPAIAVSPSREWLTVAGIAPPAAPVLRAPIAGARIGTISTRSCPQLAAGVRPVAITVSIDDEFVLFVQGQPAGGGDFVSFFRPPHPRRLLHVDAGVRRIHDAAFCRADGTLWVVGGEPGSATTPEGLWRIDAVLRRGRQEAQATCVARLDGAISLACLSKGSIVVTHGRTSRIVSRIDTAGGGDGDGRAPDAPAGGKP